MFCYKFSPWASEKAPENINYESALFAYKNRAYGLDNLLSRGEIRLSGWAFSFRDKLKKYVIKQYGNWREIYAPNKTLARKAIYGKIEKIVEI